LTQLETTCAEQHYSTVQSLADLERVAASPDLPATAEPKITSMSYGDFQLDIYLAGVAD
jgi:hypothetical protein